MKTSVLRLGKLSALTSTLLILVTLCGTLSTATVFATTQPQRPLCQANAPLCTEVVDSLNYDGLYTGHDEPSLLFYSNTPGSGNSNLYHLTLPKEPPTMPTQDGKGGTYNFQLHPAFWFGMALCDTQSSPAPATNHSCKPDSDENIANSSNPSDPHYIGKHAGTAFMEMQFYPPGWVPWPAGVSCDPKKWCASLNIDSLSRDYNLGQDNNETCVDQVGLEYVNFAFITKNGHAHAPASPVEATPATFTPNPTTDLFMNSGDTLVVDMHDTPAGFQVVIRDLTTGQSGSMTASIANHFGQVKYDPNGTGCTNIPYAFHPMYSTSSENTRVPWAAHSYNVAFSDEIGHFEYCSQVDAEGGNCTAPSATDPSGPDGDDQGCFSSALSLLVKIGGCIATDADFDGPPYQFTWPGSIKDPRIDRKYNPSSILFTSPLFKQSRGHDDDENGDGELRNYSRVAFETDLPRIEAPDSGGICNRTTGANCVNPPAGANFYPIFSTRSSDEGERCIWQLGGAYIPGTTNTFGGNSTVQYGPLLSLVYPSFGNPTQAIFRYNDFRRILPNNPCKAGDD